MNKSELKAIFINAKATDAKYIGVSIQTEGSNQNQIVIVCLHVVVKFRIKIRIRIDDDFRLTAALCLKITHAVIIHQKKKKNLPQR